MALNIVHAVEFSRNGRTQQPNPKPGQPLKQYRSHPAIQTGRIRTHQTRKKHTFTSSGSSCQLEDQNRRISAIPLRAPVGQRRTTIRGNPSSAQTMRASRACRTRDPGNTGRPSPRSLANVRHLGEAPRASGSARHACKGRLASPRRCEEAPTRDLLTAEGSRHIFYSQRIVNALASTARSGGTASVRTAALRTRSRRPAAGAPLRMLNAA